MDELAPFWARNFVQKIARATPVLGLKPSTQEVERDMRLLSKKFNDI